MKTYVYVVDVNDEIPSAVTADDIYWKINAMRGVETVRELTTGLRPLDERSQPEDTPPEPSLTSMLMGFINTMRETDTPTLQRWAKNPQLSQLRRDTAALVLAERGVPL